MQVINSDPAACDKFNGTGTNPLQLFFLNIQSHLAIFAHISDVVPMLRTDKNIDVQDGKLVHEKGTFSTIEELFIRKGANGEIAKAGLASTMYVYV